MAEEAINPKEETTIEAHFAEIMTSYGNEILQLAYSYVKNVAIAEDLTQEIFVKCYFNLADFKGKASVRTWLYRIAINHCKDYLKSWHHRNISVADQQVFDLKSSPINIEAEFERNVLEEQLVAAIMQLPIDYRLPIYFYYFQEMPVKEIGQVLDVKTNTVKTRLRRARVLLKGILVEE